MSSNNGVTTTEDSDLQHDRLFNDKEGKLSFQNKTILLWTCLTLQVNCVLNSYVKNSKQHLYLESSTSCFQVHKNISWYTNLKNNVFSSLLEKHTTYS